MTREYTNLTGFNSCRLKARQRVLAPGATGLVSMQTVGHMFVAAVILTALGSQKILLINND